VLRDLEVKHYTLDHMSGPYTCSLLVHTTALLREGTGMGLVAQNGKSSWALPQTNIA